MKYDANMVTLTKEEVKEYKDILANNLVALRKMLYLSQTEFGNRTGISRIRLSMIECGKYLAHSAGVWRKCLLRKSAPQYATWSTK